MALNLGELLATLGLDTSGWDGAIKSSEKALDGLVTAATAASVAIAAGLGAAVVAGVETAAQMETTAVAFETMLGSAEAAQSFMEGMKDFAAKTPFEFPEIADSAQNLIAMGIAAQDTLNVIAAAGDAASSMGKGAEGMRTITGALGKVQSQGKLTAESMNTLAEQGGFAWSDLAKAMGVSVDQVRKDVTDGAISSTEAINAFMSSTFESAGGLMDKQSRTLIGLWSTFKDTVGQLLGDAMAPLVDNLKGALPAATTFLETLRPGFESLAASLGSVIEFVARMAAGFNAMSPAAQQAALQMVAVGAAVTVLIAGIGLLVSSPLLAFLAAIAAGFVTWGILLAGVSAGWFALGQAVDSFKDAFSGTFDKAKEVVAGALDAVTGFFRTAATWTDAFLTTIRDSWIDIANIVGLINDFAAEDMKKSTAFGDIKMGLTVSADAVGAIADTVITGVKEAVDGVKITAGELLPSGFLDAFKAFSPVIAAATTAGNDYSGGLKNGADAVNAMTGAANGAAASWDSSFLDNVISDMQSTTDSIVFNMEEFEAGMAEAADAIRRSAIGEAVSKLGNDLISSVGLGGVQSAAQEGGDMAGLLGMAPGIGMVAGALLNIAQQSEGFAAVQESVNNALATVAEAFTPLFEVVAKLIDSLGPVIDIIAQVIAAALDPLANLLSGVMVALEPVMFALQAIAPLFTMLSGILDPMEPALKVLAAVLKVVAIIMLAIAIAIGSVWNAVIDAIMAVVGIFKKDSSDMMKNLEGMKLDVDEMKDSMQALTDGTWDNVEATAEDTAVTATATAATHDTTAAMDALTESLTNVPEGFKVAQARFEEAAADVTLAASLAGGLSAVGATTGSVFVGTIPAFAQGAIVTAPTVALAGERGPEAVIPLDQLGSFMGGGDGGGMTINIGTIIADTPEEFVAALERELSRKALTRSGFPALTRSRFAAQRTK